MGSDFRREAPNVVTETYFKSLIDRAFQAEVVCRKSANKKAAVWYGEWIIRVVDQEKSTERLLVPARGIQSDSEEIPARIFKTANGLISFLQRLGFTHVSIPLYEGGRSSHVLPQEIEDNSHS